MAKRKKRKKKERKKAKPVFGTFESSRALNAQICKLLTHQFNITQQPLYLNSFCLLCHVYIYEIGVRFLAEIERTKKKRTKPFTAP